MDSVIEKINQVPYAMLVLSWIAYGLAASVTAKLILPGPENMGWIRTILVGIAGSFIGGYAAKYLGVDITVGWNFPAFAAAVAGSLVLLLINRVVTRS